MADTFLSSFVLNEERANLPGLDKGLMFFLVMSAV